MTKDAEKLLKYIVEESKHHNNVEVEVNVSAIKNIPNIRYSKNKLLDELEAVGVISGYDENVLEEIAVYLTTDGLEYFDNLDRDVKSSSIVFNVSGGQVNIANDDGKIEASVNSHLSNNEKLMAANNKIDKEKSVSLDTNIVEADSPMDNDKVEANQNKEVEKTGSQFNILTYEQDITDSPRNQNTTIKIKIIVGICAFVCCFVVINYIDITYFNHLSFFIKDEPNSGNGKNLTSKLEIYIDNWEFFNDGFYYENPDPDDPWFISYTKGISGNFHYSRDLTEEEKNSWSHGGNLYDENGNEVGSEGNYPSFWSSPNGQFAIGFPQDIENGHYKYVLQQNINGILVSDSIYFDVESPPINAISKLEIYIDNWEFYDDGFYYKNPDPDDPWFISYTKGISGNFHYSRDLTEKEKNSWFHGGNLYDENGNEVGSEGNYPSFWSSPNGQFAIEFPKELPQGNYVFNLYQDIDNKNVSASIQFLYFEK